jgi:RimJ/RimL family protein N-acetyltransferase
MLVGMRSRGRTTPSLIRSARRKNYPRLLWLLLRDEPIDARRARTASLLTALHRGDASPVGFLEATRRRDVVGAAWAQLLAGRSALVWPPRIAGNEVVITSRRMMEAMDRFLGKSQTRVGQSLLAQREGPDADLLLGCGYRYAARLAYMAAPAMVAKQRPPTAELAFTKYAISQYERLARVVAATYVGTRDIPALDGARSLNDVLEGYRQTGAFDPSRWFFVQYQGQDVGCLLLADHPRSGHCELVYMGLVPTVRGRGWGLDMARYALQQTDLLGRHLLVLAVDGDNDPALVTYARAGFTEWDRRCVFLKIYSDPRF